MSHHCEDGIRSGVLVQVRHSWVDFGVGETSARQPSAMYYQVSGMGWSGIARSDCVVVISCLVHLLRWVGARDIRTYCLTQQVSYCIIIYKAHVYGPYLRTLPQPRHICGGPLNLALWLPLEPPLREAIAFIYGPYLRTRPTFTPGTSVAAL